jgi:hypothetical protein
MRWRSSLLYLLVLLILGGYYYYFEVLGEQRKNEAKRQSQRIFHVKVNDINALEINSKDKHFVRLTKEGDWQVVAPIACEVDRATLEGLLNTLATLEAERKLSDLSQDLPRFGLADPALKITFSEGKESKGLAIGARNPTGESYYAKTNDSADVFLLPQGVRGILNKGVDDLRRKDLLRFVPSEVQSVSIDWADGGKVLIDQGQGQQQWKAPGHPEIELKGSKVANLIEQLHWLRAEKFLENSSDKLADYGLDPPRAKVKVRLDKDQSIELRLGKTIDEGKGICAVSSQMPAVVMVRADIMKDLPATVENLQDRFLMTLNKDEIARVKWKLGDNQGEVMRLEENRWGWRRQGKPPKELKDSWKVSALAYDLGQAEYTKELNPMPGVPDKPQGSIEFFSENEKLAGILWSERSEKESKTIIFWIEQKGRPLMAVEGDAELVGRMEEDLRELLRSRPAEESSQ